MYVVAPRVLRIPVICLTVLVAAAFPAAGATGKASVVTYGGLVKLTGTVPAAHRGKPVNLMAKPCGFTGFGLVTTLSVPDTGKYAHRFSPTISTQLSLRVGTTQIAAASIRVRPIVDLRRRGSGRYEVKVMTAGGTTLGGRRVVLQSAPSRRGPWKVVARAKSVPGAGPQDAAGALKLTSPPTAMNAISSATITARVPRGRLIRAALAAKQAAPCYTGAVSSAIAG